MSPTAAAKLFFELASAVNEDEAEEVEGVAWLARRV